MDRMLVVVFNNETKAYEGERALLQLDAEGSISVYARSADEARRWLRNNKERR